VRGRQVRAAALVAGGLVAVLLVPEGVGAAPRESVGAPGLTPISGVASPLVRSKAVAPRAVATVLDDRSLVRSARGWVSVSDASASKRTVSRSLRTGATLTAQVLARNGGAVLVRVGPGRGRVEVRVGSVRRATYLTSAARVAARWVAFAGAGKVTVKVSSQGSRGVYVDAVKLNPPALPGYATGALRQLDRSSAGVGANGTGVDRAALSPGGRMAAFWSDATNLVPGVTDGFEHLYVSQVATGKVIGVADTNSSSSVLSRNGSSDAGRMVVAWAPIQAGDADSRFLLFATGATNLFGTVPAYDGPYLFVKDLATDALTPVPVSAVREAAWSPDGHKIAIETDARYGSDTNDFGDIWSYDLTAPPNANLFPVSTSASGAFAPFGPGSESNHFSWAKDSNRILFESRSDSLVPGDNNGVEDVFIKTISTGAIVRVSTSATGHQGNDRSGKPVWSPDNTKVAFDSKASNLVAGDTNIDYDVFVKSLSGGAITLLSKDLKGRSTLFANRAPRWSPDGKRIAFDSENSLMAPLADFNTYEDVYVTTLATGKHQLVSVTLAGRSGNFRSSQWNIFGGNATGWTPDSRGLLFFSTSSNFSTPDTNGFAPSLFFKVV
jgi:hypothetical protein